MDHAGVERWIEAYRRAWASDAPDDISALFTEDVSYSPFPWPRGERAWRGRDLVVKNWIERGDSQLGWRFDHDILAVDGDTAVVEGWTYYEPSDDAPNGDAYANIWVIRFAGDARASSFAEWWVQRPEPEPVRG